MRHTTEPSGLLHRARCGQAKAYSRISPHIRYDALHPNVVSGSRRSYRYNRESILKWKELFGDDAVDDANDETFDL